MNFSSFISGKKSLAVYLIYITAFSLSFQNYQYTYKNSTSIDLLYRTIGSRLMIDGKAPYYDKWQEGKADAARYYHPIPRYSQHINGVTVTPAVLWLNSVFADEDFCKVRNIWFYIQIVVLFLCGLLLLISFRQFRQKLIALVTFIAFFVFSRNFYLHLHSAQVYVFYTLIFCLLYLLLKNKWTNRYIYIGLLISLAVWLKPFFIVLFIPFLLSKNKEVIKGALIMLFVLIVHAIVFGHVEYWMQYLSAMPGYAEDIPISARVDFMEVIPPSFEMPSCIYPMKYPYDLPLHSAGLRSLQYYLFRLGVNIQEPKLYGIAALIMIMAMALYDRKRKLSAEQLLAMLFLVYLIVELFTPALRFGYYLVQWAAVSLITIVNYKQNKLAAGLMLLGLLINHGYIPFPNVYEGMAGEALMVLALVWFVFSNGSTRTNLNELNNDLNLEVSDTTKAT